MTPRRPLFWRLLLLILSLLTLLLTSTLSAQIRMIKDINPGSSSSSPKRLFIWRNHVYFTADDGKAGAELWRSDGTPSGTQMVKDIIPGAGSSEPDNFMAAGGRLFFIARTKTQGRELHVTDGTAAGTRMIRDIRAGNGDGALAVLGGFRGRLYFIGRPGRTGKEGLWVSDGTFAGTDWFDPKRRITTSRERFIIFGDRILFTTLIDTNIGVEPYVSDGTPQGTVLLKDISPGKASSGAKGFVVIGSKCYFQASHPSYGAEPWVTDGTSTGTRMVADIVKGSTSGFAALFTGTENSVFFAARTSTTGYELYWTDGKQVRLHDIFQGIRSSSPVWLTSIGPGEVMFQATTSKGRELWRASKDRFWLVKDINPFSGHSWPHWLTAVNSRHVLFTASNGKSGVELWRSDGTPQGTGMLQDLCLGSCDSDPGWLTRLGCKVFFSAKTPVVGHELFVADVGATSQAIGRGCAPGVRTPALSSSDPILNSTLTLSVTSAPTHTTAITVVGLPSPVPLPLDGCEIYVNAFLPYVMLRQKIVFSSYQLQVGKVPNNSSLICNPLAVQVLFSGRMRLETTNGLNLYFGK